MHPIIFQIDSPAFLRWLLPATLSVSGYGLMITVGAILASSYLWIQRKRLGVDSHIVIELVSVAALGIFLGGKLFYFLERPLFYLHAPQMLFRSPGHGFVFYGSLIGALLLLLLYLRWRSMPALRTLDSIAVSGVLLQGFGKIGCLLAGCCYGIPTGSTYGLTFDDPASQATPLHQGLVPVQVYDAILIFAVFAYLWKVTHNTHFDGQVILTYILIYSSGRFITEFVRGDLARGMVFGGLLSHAQVIAAVMIPCAIWLLRRQKARAIIVHLDATTDSVMLPGGEY